MERLAFKMKLKPGCQEEYRRRHAQVWPEILQLLKETGVSDYSIFLDEETDLLFAVQKVSGESNSQQLGHVEVQQRWWSYMADIMEVNPDDSPISIPLSEVFHAD
ncbi:MAG: L-rhamnose mutarotase [Bacteroidales bacterium]|nr:L-rhamnose mutarotase [Bacteroidales bacterium]